MSTRLLPVWALARREILQFARDRARLFGTLVQVVGIWAVMGFGFRNSFSHVDAGGEAIPYTEYLFPGMILLVVLFSSIFATIAIVEDRQTGFLHAAIISPLSRTSLALGTISGGAVMAFIQAVVLLGATGLAGLRPTGGGLFVAVVLILVTSFGFTSLGALFAWRIRTTRGFHAVMNVILMPLWVLSGALFPAEGAHDVVRFVIAINPVSYCLRALRIALSQTPERLLGPEFVTLLLAIGVSLVLFTAASLAMPRSLRTD